jgi:hypothetical protein
MSRLLRLYPAAWRERYEADSSGAQEPVFDGSVIVRRDRRAPHGLIGATPEPSPWTTAPADLVGFLGLLARRRMGYGVLIAMLLMLFAVLGDYMSVRADRLTICPLAMLAGERHRSVLNFARGRPRCSWRDVDPPPHRAGSVGTAGC